MSTTWIIAVVALWIVVLLIAVVVIGVLRRISGILEAAEAQLAATVETAIAVGGLPVASQAPEFRVFETNGSQGDRREVTSTDLITMPTLLLFMEEECGPCQQLASELASVNEVDGLPLFVVMEATTGRPPWLPAGVHVVYQTDHELSQRFQNVATPHAYALDTDRVVLAKRVVRSLNDLREMAKTARNTRGAEA